MRWKLQTSPPLPLFLTPDAVPRPRNGFEPLEFYVAAAFRALTETPLPYAFQCLGHAPEHLPGGRRLVDESLPFVLARRLIRRVGMLGGSFPRLVLRGGERTVPLPRCGFQGVA